MVGVLGSGRQSNGGRSNDRFEKLGVDLGNGAVNACKERKREREKKRIRQMKRKSKK